MSYIENISNTDYNHADTHYSLRVNNLTVDGTLLTHKYVPALASGRINVPTGPAQPLNPTDPNPSYIEFSTTGFNNLYDYRSFDDSFTILNSTTIRVNIAGDYLIGFYSVVVTDGDPGSAIFEVQNISNGAIGTVDPILGQIVEYKAPDFLTNPFQYSYVGTQSGMVTAKISANTNLRVAYMVSENCFLLPTSCLSICRIR